jgi:hypothetical protein
VAGMLFLCLPTVSKIPRELVNHQYLHSAALLVYECLSFPQLCAQHVQIHTGGLKKQPLNITPQQLEYALQF